MLAQIIGVVQILIAFECVFFAAFLLLGRGAGRISNRLLAALLGVLAYQMATNLALGAGFGGRWLNLNPALGLLHGPLQLLYARSLIQHRFRPRWRHLAHALPFAAAAVAWLAGELDIAVYAVAIYLSLLTYLGRACYEVLRCQRVLGATRSSLDELKLSWLLQLLAAALLVLLGDFAHFWLDYAGIARLRGGARLVLFLLLLLLVLLVVVKALRHPRLFAGITAEEEALGRDAASRNTASALDGRDLERIAADAAAAMAAERPYLAPGLTLAQLAGRLNVPPRHLSQAINAVLGRNFSDFVNGFRVDHARRLLADPAHRRDTVLEVLLAAGFNAKSTGNHAFRRHTGLTPSQYRTRHGG